MNLLGWQQLVIYALRCRSSSISKKSSQNVNLIPTSDEVFKVRLYDWIRIKSIMCLKNEKRSKRLMLNPYKLDIPRA